MMIRSIEALINSPVQAEVTLSESDTFATVLSPCSESSAAEIEGNDKVLVVNENYGRELLGRDGSFDGEFFFRIFFSQS